METQIARDSAHAGCSRFPYCDGPDDFRADTQPDATPTSRSASMPWSFRDFDATLAKLALTDDPKERGEA